MRPIRLILVCCAALLALAAGGSAAEAAPVKLDLGFAGTVFDGPADARIAQATAAGGQFVIVTVNWRQTAPDPRPPGFDATSPDGAGYRWAAIDRQVRAAAAGGMRVVLYVMYAPEWAIGPGRRKEVVRGTWRPDPAKLGAFATALARRYSGAHVADGTALPPAHAFQLWGEPNLESHLAPQWSGRGKRKPAAPHHYRRMLNAFYAGVKSVRRDALVVTSGTAPFGDPERGGRRMPPAMFWREALCLRGRALRRIRCANPARFDVLAHHPYSVGGPSRRALNRDDVSIPDLGKLTRIVRRAVATGRAKPKTRKRLWVTEFSWDTSPPDPDGVPAARHQRWMGEAFYRFWRQGVDTIAWFRLHDQPGPPFASTYQSGLHLSDGRPKPALRAFSFPAHAWRRGGRTTLWTRPPAAGGLEVQRRTGGVWRTARTRSVAAGRPVQVRVQGRRAPVRAVMGDRSSVTLRP